MSENEKVCIFVKRKRPNVRQLVKETTIITEEKAKRNSDSENEDDQNVNENLNDNLNDSNSDDGSLLIMKKKVKSSGALTFQSKKKSDSRKNYSLDENNFEDDFESRTAESSVFTSYKSDKSGLSTGPKDMG